MAYTLDGVLSAPEIDVRERLDDMGLFTIRIGSLLTDVSIDLGRFRNSETTKFRTSHVIHTPLQADPYRTSVSYGDYWEYALYRAVTGLTDWYSRAVEAGHTPVESWLVPY